MAARGQPRQRWGRWILGALVLLLGGAAAALTFAPAATARLLLPTARPTSLSYEGHVTMGTTLADFGESLEQTLPLRFSYQAPNLMRLENSTPDRPDYVLVVSDGAHLFVEQAGGKRVLRLPAPADFRELAASPAFQDAGFGLSPLGALDPTDPYAALDDLQRLRPGRAAGEWLRALDQPAGAWPVTLTLDPGIELTVWVDPRTRRPRQIATEVTGEQLIRLQAKRVEEQGEELPPELAVQMRHSLAGISLRYAQTFERYEENPALPAATFAYAPPATAEVVDVADFESLLGEVLLPEPSSSRR